MAHLQTPPRQSSTSRAKTFGLITPSTPVNPSRRTKECPDAPFLPSNFFPLRTSPRSKKGDPTKSTTTTTTHIRTRTVTGDRGTLIQPGMPPTPAETPVQKRRREQEMRARIEAAGGLDTTGRRLFPAKTTPIPEEPSFTLKSSTSFDIFTDSMHREPVSSPNNPFAVDHLTPARGHSPRKRRRPAPTLGPDEMKY